MLLPSGATGAVLALATLACVIAQLAILRTVRATAAAPVTPDRRPATALEAFWSVLPAVALVLILLFAWRQHGAQRADAPAAPASGVTA